MLRSLIFTAFFLLWTFVYGIFFSIVCPFLPFPRRFGLARIWGRVLLWTLKWICGLGYRIEGLENLPPGNHVALWKHSSSWETVAMAVVIPAAGLGLEARAHMDPIRRLGHPAAACHRDRSKVGALGCQPGGEAGKAAACRGQLDRDFSGGDPHAPGRDTQVRSERSFAGQRGRRSWSCPSRTMRDATGHVAGCSRSPERSGSRLGRPSWRPGGSRATSIRMHRTGLNQYCVVRPARA